MWKLHLLENVLLPGNQQRDKKKMGKGGGKKKKRKKKRSPPPELRERRIKTTKLPAAGKTTTTKTQNKIIQEASESSVETTTFISLYNYVQLDFIQVKQWRSPHGAPCVCSLVFCVLGGAALGEVGVEDGGRHGDHHCDDRHPGAPAALLERDERKKHTRDKNRRRNAWINKVSLNITSKSGQRQRQKKRSHFSPKDDISFLFLVQKFIWLRKKKVI